MSHVWLYFNPKDLVIRHDHVHTHISEVLVALEGLLQFRKNRCDFRSYRLFVNVGLVGVIHAETFETIYNLTTQLAFHEKTDFIGLYLLLLLLNNASLFGESFQVISQHEKRVFVVDFQLELEVPFEVVFQRLPCVLTTGQDRS